MLTQAEIAAIQGTDIYDDCLEHSGVKGMHWYERRYQYPDGRLTPLGRLHYGIGQRRKAKKKEIMQSGNVKKILKYQKHLTDKEFEKAMARAKKSDELRKVGEAPKKEKKADKVKDKLSEQEIKKAEQTIKDNAKQKTSSSDFKEKLAKAATITGTIVTLYKNSAQILKLLGVDVPTIDGGKEKKEKEKKEKSDGGGSGSSPVTVTSSPVSDSHIDFSPKIDVTPKIDIGLDLASLAISALSSAASKPIIDEGKAEVERMERTGILDGIDPFDFLPDT